MKRIRKSYLVVLSVLALIVPVVIGLTNKPIQADAASANSVYFTPTPVSVKTGASFTVTMRINPAAATNGVQSTISYDTSKLDYVSGALSTTPFSLALQPLTSSTAGKLSFAVGSLSSDVTTDSLIGTFTFKAKVSSGTTSLSMTSGTTASSTNSTSDNGWLNPSLVNATINFAAATVATCPTGQTGTPPNCVTPPVATCPSGQTGTPPNCVTTPVNCAAGQTGTPPNCVTPAPAACATGYTGTPPNCVKKTTTTTGTVTTPVKGTPVTKDPTPVTSTPVTATPVSVGNTKSSSEAPTVSVDSVQSQYTQSKIQITTSTLTTAYVVYGTSKANLTSKTDVMPLAKIHVLTFDASKLKPGTTYYYAAVATDTSGNQTQTSVQTFRTRGMYIKIHVTDKNGHPVRHRKVTLHSTPTVVTTDDDGYATFTDVEAGNHKLIYSNGLATYTQPVTVASIVLTSGDGQTTTAQTATIRYPFNSSDTIVYILAGIILLLIAVLIYAFFYIRKSRKPLYASGPSTDSFETSLSGPRSSDDSSDVTTTPIVSAPYGPSSSTTPDVPTTAPTTPTTPVTPPVVPPTHDMSNIYFNQNNETDTQAPWQNEGKK